MAISLISLDVGGTLGYSQGQTVTTILSSVSKLPSAKVQHILRSTLLVAPKITASLIEALCKDLEIDPTSFPENYVSPPFQLYPWTLTAIRSFSQLAPVITLSNVSCLDFDNQLLRDTLGKYVAAHHPSCELGYAKPDPQAFQSVIAMHYATPASFVHVGDNWECDVLGALAIGARAIWISGGRDIPDDKLSMPPERLVIARDLADASACLSTLFTSSMTVDAIDIH